MTDWDTVLEAYPIGTAVGSGERATATPELRAAAGRAITWACDVWEAGLAPERLDEVVEDVGGDASAAA